jgi:hypothetical protein
MTKGIVCDGCGKLIEGDVCLYVVTDPVEAPEDDDGAQHFHDWDCVRAKVSDQVVTSAAQAYKDKATGGEVPEVTKSNILDALNALDGSALTIMKSLTARGIKGVCSNPAACPLAQYLVEVFHRPAIVQGSSASVSKFSLTELLKKTSRSKISVNTLIHMSDGDLNGGTYMVSVPLPAAHAEFVRRFDNREFASVQCGVSEGERLLQAALGEGLTVYA